jgi:ribose transport system ATP-binding protein
MHAARLGLSPVFQDPALVPDLSVTQNLRLTGARVEEVRSQLAAMDLRVNFRELVADLPLPILRMLDLARALAQDPQLLILDEITAALPSDLAERVFDVMRIRRDRGRSVLFITHRLAEVIATCDRATILRDGSDVGTMAPQEGGEARIVEIMLGPEAARAEARAAELAEDEVPAEPAAAATAKAVSVLEVDGLRIGGLQGVSFDLRRGEVLGLAALEGQGHDELFEALAGQRKPEGGELRVSGKAFRPRHPYDAIRKQIVLVPPDRLLALLPQRPVRENVAAPLYNSPLRWGPINMREEGRRVRGAVDALQIDMRAARQVRRLSGGNQQKVTIARWLASGFAALLCNDPTRGIDVGTKRQVYALLRDLANDGAAILFFSSELAEFPLVCDRVLTIYGGRVTAELPGAAADEASLLHAMHGLEIQEAVA